MTIDELLELCEFCVATPQKMRECESFSCGDSVDEQDLNEFFAKDASVYSSKLLGKTYLFCLRGNPNRIVSAFTVANDSIRLTNKLSEEYRYQFLEETELRDKDIKRFPGVLLGRLATDKSFAGHGFGSAVMDFIKSLFVKGNKTGCRFIIVDALNNKRTINYYKRNGFQYLVEDELLEAKYVGIGISHLPLRTRLMYFDLLTLNVG